MAKYLILSPDPTQRWQLPDAADVQDLESKLFQALEHGREEGREGYVLTIPVMIDGQQTAIHIREHALWVAAVVDVEKRGPQVF